MEKNTLLAITLSILVLVVWSFFFRPTPQPQKIIPVEQTEPTPIAVKETKQSYIEIPAVSSVTEDINGTDVIVETRLYKAVFSTKGAVIKSWELKGYKDKDNIPVELLKKPGAVPPLGILFESANRNLPQKIIYGTNTERLILSDRKRQGEIVFFYKNQGMSIRKRLLFYNDDYRVDISIETPNAPSYLLPVGTDFGIFEDDGGRTHIGPILLIDSDMEKFTQKSESKYFTGNIRWIAQEDKYFTAAIIPVSNIDGVNVWKEGDKPEIALKLSRQKQDFVLYAGPKEYDRLKHLNMGLEHIIDFGWFSIVAMPLFWVLKFFNNFLGNYGWSIVLLTIIIRIPFIPLLNKSQKSMKKMQTIQPLMAELKEKYKKDPQKMQKETMKLYKKHKVNPVGGCLPMLLQIPVFIALYNVLLQAIELRGAHWIFWIKDLAAKDPYYVLPIVMGLTMVLQQKMTPTAMDPKQAKMMMLMPIVFTFMFLTFPAGLVLYWLVNNVLAITQQYFVNKKAS